MKELYEIQQALVAPKAEKNDFGGFMYRTAEGILEAVKPLLAEHRCTLTLSDEMVEVGGNVYVKTLAVLMAEPKTDRLPSSATSTAFAREPESKKGMDSSQITGAASSYARKYALCGLFAIDDNRDPDKGKPDAPEDDKPKPPIDMRGVRSDKGRKMIAHQKTAAEAVAYFEQTRTVTTEQAEEIKSIWVNCHG